LDNLAADELFRLMQTASNNIYGVSWYSDIEYSLFESTIIGPIPLNGYWLDRTIVDQLHRLSERCNGWWMWDEDLETHKFVDMETWEELSGMRRVD
jgi:hypothetical protein